MSKKGLLRYPEHRFKPEDTLSFIETKAFTRFWQKLKLTDDDLLLVQILIMCHPTGPPVIAGSGGVRKIRFSPFSAPKGKSGALRLCYAYFERHHTVALGIVYPKGVQEDLSAAELQRIALAISEIEQELDR